MNKVLSVDDHALLREGIEVLVNEESDMKAGRGTAARPGTDGGCNRRHDVDQRRNGHW